MKYISNVQYLRNFNARNRIGEFEDCSTFYFLITLTINRL